MNINESEVKGNGCWVARGGWSLVRVTCSVLRDQAIGCCGRGILVCLLLLSLSGFAANGETLGVLQVGQKTYQNVSVGTKAKDYILIVHSSGIASIKVKQLPEDVLEELGYASGSNRSTQTSAAAALTQPVARGAKAFVEEMQAGVSGVWHGTEIARRMMRSHPVRVVVAAAVLVLAQLFCSYCGMLICRKSGKEPGILVWIPVLQAVPLLRAASMPTWWFGGLFVPGLNLVGYVLWCVKIVEARQKTMPLAMLLIFPLTSWFAFMFLALSEDSHEREKVQVESMILDTVCASESRSWVSVLTQCERHIVA
jgi:hypothetical protein